MPQPGSFDADMHLFAEIYANGRGKDPAGIPWAHARPHPLLSAWLDDLGAQRAGLAGQRALVVGCGLGDDANALAECGMRVTAFDYSPESIAWAKERFPNADIAWHVQDLFAPPEAWRQAFDLVVEIHTIQALRVTLRQAAITAIAGAVADGGTLFMVTMTRDVRDPSRGQPWLLTEREIRSVERHGLTEIDRFTIDPDAPAKSGRARITFQRAPRS